MDNNMNNLRLAVPEYIKEKLSTFRFSLIIKELSNINEKFPLKEGNMDMQISYVVEDDNGLEVEFYIRNNTKFNINMETIPITLVKENEIIAKKIADFKSVPDIPPFSAVPVTVQFYDKEIYKYDFKDISIRLGFENNYFLAKTQKVELDNLPERFKYRHKKTLEDYVSTLPRLRKNSMDIHGYSVFYDEDNNLNLVIVLRNGYDSDLEVNNIPFSVFDCNDILVYADEFKPVSMNVEKNSAKIYIISVEEKNLPIKDADFSTFRVEFEV
jgi:SLAP domain-containing protein